MAQLLAYVPYPFAAALIENPARNPVDHEQRFEAATLFADISGFTRLSEELAGYVRGGTEALTVLLNSYFDAMISLIDASLVSPVETLREQLTLPARISAITTALKPIDINMPLPSVVRTRDIMAVTGGRVKRGRREVPRLPARSRPLRRPAVSSYWRGTWSRDTRHNW